MAVTTTGVDGGAVGANSAKISYTAGETTANILAAIDVFLTARGWTQIDNNTGLAGSANAYTAPNFPDSAAAVDLKTVVIQLDATKNVLLRVYESWNAGTHVGLNLAFNSDATIRNQQYDLVSGGDLYIFAKASYICLLSITPGTGHGSSTNNGPSAIGEFTREHPANTVAKGVPTFGFINLDSWAQPSNSFLLSFPRTALGQTSSAASSVSGVSTPYGHGGPDSDGSTITVDGIMPEILSAWDGGNTAVTPFIGAYGFGQNEPKGFLRFFTLIQRRNGSAIDDEISVNINADGIADRNGTLTPCWIIGDTDVISGFRYAFPK